MCAMFAVTPSPEVLWANCAKTHVMLPPDAHRAASRTAPQSPLTAGQEQQKRREAARKAERRNLTATQWRKTHRPITAKITGQPPLRDFYWGARVRAGAPLTPRMQSLQRGT